MDARQDSASRIAALEAELARANELLEDRHGDVAAELSRVQELNRRIIEALPGGIVHVAADGAIQLANSEALRFLGMSFDALSQRYTVDFEPETIFEDGSPCTVMDYPVTQALMSGEARGPSTIGVRNSQGELSWAVFRAVPVKDATGSTTGAVATFIDITARKEAESESLRMGERVAEKTRLESVGRLAAGVAHDFNNLLTVIMSAASMSARLSSSEQLTQLSDKIILAASKGARLTSQLLNYGQKQLLSPESLDLNHAAEELIRTLEGFLPGNISLESKLSVDELPVLVDRGQLDQLLLNLCLNARDAMPDGGTLLIEAERKSIVDDEELSAGLYCLLHVRDTGEGIGLEQQAKVFDPYFTTKRDSGGVGLGLASARGFARQSGGSIRLHSVPGEGTVFTICLPLFDGAAREKSAKNSGDGWRCRFEDRSPRILLVDDNVELSKVCSALLALDGFEVRVAGGFAEAVELHGSADHPFDALITDVVMPDGDGMALVEALRSRQGELPVLFVSAYPERNPLSTHEFEKSAFLGKPFSTELFVSELGRLLS